MKANLNSGLSQVFIIGFGYVGKHLGISLIDQKGQGTTLSCTTTSPERLDEIRKLNIIPYLISHSELSPLQDILFEQDLIVLSLAPKKGASYEETYLKSALGLQKICKKSPRPLSIIYLSSTSVYGDQQGCWTTEETPLSPLTPQAEILCKTEAALKDLTPFGHSITIFRLGEIYGPGRLMVDKVRALSERRSGFGSGNNYSNTIHQEDIVRAIHFAFEFKLAGIYNLVDDSHTLRKELYQKIATLYGLPTLNLDQQNNIVHGGNKRISNEKIKNAGFCFLYPNLIL
jgi:nucleoside-diphosphate-sugar epimerase